ncbi:MAG: hypothetical protein IPI35_35515 [Deltaproteobacteria bacterium]|nr:hypothetical protein [Deltaproteobacteria bacterium]
MSPARTPSRPRMLRCFRFGGYHALDGGDVQSTTASTPEAPAIIVRPRRAWVPRHVDERGDAPRGQQQRW